MKFRGFTPTPFVTMLSGDFVRKDKIFSKLKPNSLHLKANKGFTLIELLVVIAIIGMLSSVVLASLNSAREKARDAKRIADLREIEKALELYFDDNGEYPTYGDIYYYAQTPRYGDYIAGGPGCGYSGAAVASGGSWCKLEEVLGPYIRALPRDETGNVQSRYVYKKPNGFDVYGLRVILENPSAISENDGGYSNNWFELGGLPSYCMENYTGSNANWSYWSYTSACQGGN